MKKTFPAVILTLLALVLLMGCATSFTPLDLVEGPVNSATVSFFVPGKPTASSSLIYLHRVDETKIDAFVTFAIRIPAGKVTLTGDAVVNTPSVTFKARGLTVTCDFKPGGAYIILPAIEGEGQIVSVMGISKVSKGGYTLVLKIYEVEFIYDEKDPAKIVSIRDREEVLAAEPAAILPTGVVFK
jgi:hypothetical protein